MGHYEAECPFCGYAIDMIDSEYPYPNGGCGDCGAVLQMNNALKRVETVLGLPRTEWEWNTFAKDGTLDPSEFRSYHDVADHLIGRIETDPSRWFRIKEPIVDDETIAAVLDAGVNGDADYGVSSKRLTEADLAEFGVEV